MKPWWKSRTVWVNIIVGVLSVIETQVELLKPYVPAGWFVIVAIGLPVVNIVLRLVTTTAVTK